MSVTMMSRLMLNLHRTAPGRGVVESTTTRHRDYMISSGFGFRHITADAEPHRTGAGTLAAVGLEFELEGGSRSDFTAAHTDSVGTSGGSAVLSSVEDKSTAPEKR